MNYYIIISLLILFSLYILFLILLKKKIYKLEKSIIYNFKEKNNLIPSLFEVTNDSLNKHDKIFNEILSLRNKDFSENSYLSTLLEKSRTYKLIHRELDFILRVCSKHPKLEKKPKFTLIKENILSKSEMIGNKIITYKKIVNKFNNLVTVKNITIIGLFIPIKKIKKI